MPSCFLTEVLTPEKSFFCSEIQSIILPCADGYMSVQKMHASEVIAVVPGVVKVQTKEGEWREFSVSFGFMEIRPDEAILFAETAEWPEDIDVARAERDRQEAEEILRQKRSNTENQESQLALAKAMARLKLGRHRMNIN